MACVCREEHKGIRFAVITMFMNPILTVDVTDEIQPLLERMAGMSKKSISAAAKSLGWYLRGEIKQGVKSGAPGGETFKERRPLEVRKALGGGSAASKWYGRMVNAIGYQYTNGTLRIGWTSRTAAMYGRKQEFGNVTKVTEEIRRRFARAGYPLRKDTTEIVLPERNVFDPMTGELYPQIAPYVQQKLNEYASGDVAFSKRSRRKYRVYYR